MKTIADIGDVTGKTIFVRVDYNVPIVDGKVGDDYRIQKSFQTIDALLAKGAQLVLASHIESEEGSLKPVFEYLKTRYPVTFVENYSPETPDLAHAFAEKSIILLENLRKYDGEKANDPVFAKHLASFADMYVNEAFPAAHRAHASVVGVPQYLPHFAGFVFEEEILNLSKVFVAPHPFVFILGGAKFETKLPLVQKFFPKVDTLFVGGALANDFLKAKGLQTGASLLSKGDFHIEDFFTDKLKLPTDVIVKEEDMTVTKSVNDVKPDDMICDVGPESIEALKPMLANAKCILWNGPLGNYENGFKSATLALAQAIADSPAQSIVGGGDTIASIAELNLTDKFTFISTAGGAMLEFLAKETLPGIEALN